MPENDGGGLERSVNDFYASLAAALSDASVEPSMAFLTSSGFASAAGLTAAALDNVREIAFDPSAVDALETEASRSGILRLRFAPDVPAALYITKENGFRTLACSVLVPLIRRAYTGTNHLAMHDITASIHTPKFHIALRSLAGDMHFPAELIPVIAALVRYTEHRFTVEKAADLARLKNYLLTQVTTAITHITLIGKAYVLPDDRGRLVPVTEKYGMHEHNYFRAGIFYDTTLGFKPFDYKGITHYYHPSRFPVIFDAAVHDFRDRVEREIRARFLSDSYASPADMPKSMPIDASGMDPFLAALCAEKVALENVKETREKIEYRPALDAVITASKGKFRYDKASGELISAGGMKEPEFKEIAKLYPRADDKETVHRLYQRSQPSLSAGNIEKLIDLNIEDIRLEVIAERWPFSSDDADRFAGYIKLAASLDQLKQLGRKLGYYFRQDIVKAVGEHVLHALFFPVTRDGSLYSFRPDVKARTIRSSGTDERKKDVLLQWFFTFAREERVNAREQKRRFSPFAAKDDKPKLSAEQYRIELGRSLYKRYIALAPRTAAAPTAAPVMSAPVFSPLPLTEAASWLSFTQEEIDLILKSDLKQLLVESSRGWKAAVAIAPEAVFSAVRNHFPKRPGWDVTQAQSALSTLKRTLGQQMKITAFDRFVRLAVLMQLTVGGEKTDTPRAVKAN